MRYHFSFDTNIATGTTLYNISHDGQIILEERSTATKPKNFKAVGDERKGFDSDKFTITSTLDKFQYINQDGDYSTVTIHDHNPGYLAELSTLEDSDAFIDEVLGHLTVENNHIYSEFDFVI